jgi:hypothetical protein
MANNNSDNGLGALLVVVLAVAAAAIATMVVIVAGCAIGAGIGFKNYCKAFHANVRRELPRSA